MKNRFVYFESFSTRRQGNMALGVDFVARECKKKKRLHQQQAKEIVLKDCESLALVEPEQVEEFRETTCSSADRRSMVVFSGYCSWGAGDSWNVRYKEICGIYLMYLARVNV
jgi:hypothetical protein